MSVFGERLKALREKAGLSQQQLADLAGMHRFGIAKLERKEREPGWETVLTLAKSLGVSCEAFAGDGKESKPLSEGKRGRPLKADIAQPSASQSKPAFTKKRITKVE